jgi:hypothetical protein
MFFRLRTFLLLYSIVVSEPDNLNLASNIANPQTSSSQQQNSEKDQQDPELRKKFQEKLCENLSTKDKDGNIVKKISF